MVRADVLGDRVTHLDVLLRLDRQNQDIAVGDQVDVVLGDVDTEALAEKRSARLGGIRRDHAVGEKKRVAQDAMHDALGRVPRADDADFILCGHVLCSPVSGLYALSRRQDNISTC